MERPRLLVLISMNKLVDAVISQDSDCFAYGARRVYRNFSVSNSAGGGALQGSVDCYDAETMYKSNGFGRNKMVALALLCGCDYGLGACGSSITTAVSFLHTIPEKEVVPRLLSWVTNPEHFEQQNRWLNVPGRCDRCGHAGRTHGRHGCPVCVTNRGCDDTGHKAKVAEVKRELSLRQRALTCGAPFPEPKVMKEFMHTPPEKIDVDKLKFPTPSLIQFMKLMTNKLDWSERYCVEKFLPLLTKWHLQDDVPCRTIQATFIKKKRNPRGVPSFEVVWADINGQYEGIIPDDQFDEDEDPLVAWTTTERQDLMRKYYAQVVEAYEESIKKPPKEKKTRTRKKKENENPDNETKPKRKYTRKPKNIKVTEQLNASKTGEVKDSNTSVLNVSVPVNKLKRKIKNNTKKQKTLHSFIASKKRRTSKKSIQSLRQSFRKMSITCDYPDLAPITNDCKISNDLDDDKENKNVNKHYLSLLNSSDDEDVSDLSDIINKIVTRSPKTKTAKVDNCLVRLVFEKYSTPKKKILRKSVLDQVHNNCSTPIDSPIRKSRFRISNNFNNSVISKVNTSYFFDKLTEDGDAFEMSLEQGPVAHSDSTVEYSLPDVCL